MTETIFRDATIVTPGSVIERGSLVVRDGRIASILPPPDWRHLAPGAVVIEARDRLLLPGLVDLHNDGIEQELEPRPRAEFPLAVALHSLENRLVSHGITTIFHSFSFMDGRDGSLTPARLEPTIRDLCRLRATGSIRHLVHARYEIVETRHVEALARLIDEGALNLVSFMDHTPGQGQYTDPTHLVSYFMRKYGASAADIDALLRERERKARDPGIPLALSRLAARTREAGLPIASHDDDTPAKVGKMRELGATISEFPVSLEAATAARRAGMHVTVGRRTSCGGARQRTISAHSTRCAREQWMRCARTTSRPPSFRRRCASRATAWPRSRKRFAW